MASRVLCAGCEEAGSDGRILLHGRVVWRIAGKGRVRGFFEHAGPRPSQPLSLSSKKLLCMVVLKGTVETIICAEYGSER